MRPEALLHLRCAGAAPIATARRSDTLLWIMTAPLDVLIVEDDTSLREVLSLHLQAERWTVRGAGSADEALAACAERKPDVVVLDIMLPGGRSGIEVCAALRALYDPSPGVVMLTARDREVDVILGFEVGADDYVIKPCRPREVVARVGALGRRVQALGRATASDAVIERGTIRIDLEARRAAVAGVEVRLTPTELDLLALLARTPDKVYTRMQLLERIWESAHEGYARNVDCHVTRVRRKLEAAGLEPAPIQTVHGTGYRFVTPRAHAP
jgi:DNA-binding response OmpR family regulator